MNETGAPSVPGADPPREEPPRAEPPRPDPPREDPPDNPFERLRSRWLVPCTLGAGAAILILLLLLTEMVGLATGGALADDDATRQILSMLAGYGGMIAWLVWACRRAGVDLGRLIGRVPAGHDWAITGALLAVTITFSYGSWELVAWILSRAAPEVLNWLVRMLPENPAGNLGHDIFTVLILVVAAPLVEEVLFRGVLVSRWGVKWGLGTGIVLSAAAFGVLHANVVGIGVVGLVAAILYIRTRTLIVPIVFHATNNVIGAIGMYLPGGSDTTAIIDGDGWLGFLLVFVTLPILIWYVWRFWPKRGAAIPYMGGEDQAAPADDSAAAADDRAAAADDPAPPTADPAAEGSR